MNKLINAPANTVVETLQGLEFAHPDLLCVQYDPNFVHRCDAPISDKVTLIGGSGSGHEPLNTGYVGLGMLDAACPGNVFTSPTAEQYIAATLRVIGEQGVLFVKKNFAGGVFNIDMAMEWLVDEGYEVNSVLIRDDVAVDERENRRALGATVLVEKIAGAAAERGWPLDHVRSIAQQAADNTRSMGAALTGCTPPAVGQPTFALTENEVELGVGIHGEPGRERTEISHADEVVDRLLGPIWHDLDLQAGDQAIVMVNGLGGTPLQELYIVYRHVHEILSARGVRIERRLVGDFITSLEMAGCSVSVMRADSELLSLWDAPVRTATLHW